MTAVVTHARVNPKVEVEVSCQAPDLELLFVEWLNAIIYEMAVRNMLFARFAVTIEGTRLKGRCGASRSMSRGMRRPVSRRARPTPPEGSPRKRTVRGRQAVSSTCEWVDRWTLLVSPVSMPRPGA